MSKVETTPRALIHQKILDNAADDPDASLEDIATDVSGANPDLVERVLNEYGDPGADDTQSDSDGQEATQAVDSSRLPEDYGTFELDALRAIYEHPEASQRDLAGILGVAPSTVNRRVNSIRGFEWNDRETFVERLFEGSADADDTDEIVTQDTDIVETNGHEPTDELDELARRLDRLEERVQTGGETRSAFRDPELVHKIVHACMEADRISDEDELRIISELLK